MKIQPLQDYEFIKSFIFDDEELFKRCSDDFTEKEHFHPELMYWVGYYEQEECKGLMSFSVETGTTLTIHVHVPKRHRGKESFKIGNSLLMFIINNCDSRFRKLNAKIPVVYPDVIRFAEKNGFEKEGIDRLSICKDGKYIDRVIMGRLINE